MIKGLNIPFTDVINIKSTFEVMLFGRGSAFPLPSYKWDKRTKGLAGGHETLYSFHYSPKNNCDLWRVITNKRRGVENPLEQITLIVK